MTIIFAMKAIKPKSVLSSNRVRAYVLNALKEEGKEMKKTLEDDVCGTWNHKPAFTEPVVRYSGGDALIAVATGDAIFGYLNNGTMIRYAALSSDWVSKTSPRGGLRSRPQQGQVLRKGRRAGAHKGIEARNFTQRVAAKHGPRLGPRLRDAIAKGTGGP